MQREEVATLRRIAAVLEQNSAVQAIAAERSLAPKQYFGDGELLDDVLAEPVWFRCEDIHSARIESFTLQSPPEVVIGSIAYSERIRLYTDKHGFAMKRHCDRQGRPIAVEVLTKRKPSCGTWAEVEGEQ